MGKDTDQNTFSIVQQETEQKLARDYPTLYKERFVLVDNRQTRLALDDISYKTDASTEEGIELLLMSCKGWVEMYDTAKLTDTLALRMQTFLQGLDKKRTLVLFPGNGAQVVKDRLMESNALEGLTTADVETQRQVDQKGSVVGVEIVGKNQVREKISATKPDTILVFDDVISTGSTLTALQTAFPVRNAQWYAATLMTLSPIQNRRNGKPSGVDGYKSIITSVVYQGISGIPALNSLSTLIGDSPKSEVVRAKYIDDYVSESETFAEAVQMLRQRLS